MIDFSQCQIEYSKFYDGLNGKKMSIYYNNELYMLKFPKENHINDDSYASSTVNEYISSNIFKILGFNTQETLLGHYNGQVVVACKDFEHFENQLFSFGKVKNSIFDTSDSFYDADLYETLETIQNQKSVNPTDLKQHFWEMFIADTLIANFDRHNGNWGLLTNLKTRKTSIAPIFDCGSSLYPKLNMQDIENYLKHRGSFNDLMFNQTSSAITINNKKINPQSFLKNEMDKDVFEALIKVYSRINVEKIQSLIDNVEIISDIRKEFYKLVIEERTKFLKNVIKRQEQNKTNLHSTWANKMLDMLGIKTDKPSVSSSTPTQDVQTSINTTTHSDDKTHKPTRQRL